MDSSKVRFLLFFIILALVAVSVYEGYLIIGLNDEISRINAESTATINELTSERDLLIEKNENADRLNSALTDSLTQATVDYSELESNVEDTIQTINLYKDELSESMAWFKDNSKIDSLPKASIISSYLKNNCVYVSGTTCRIKTGCFYYINYEKFDIRYINDAQLDNVTDHLQSISSFMSNKGGDCEDYSLFFKAQYNYLRNYCVENGASNVRFEAWDTSGDSDETYYVEYDREWFLEGVTRVDIDDDFLPYPNIICGNMYDLNRNQVNGHCMVAFTRGIIKDNDDLSLLDNAVIIEPQNGKYMGRINRDSSGILLVNHIISADINSSQSFIYEVITDEDLFLFSFNANAWLNYNLLFRELLDQSLGLYFLIKDDN